MLPTPRELQAHLDRFVIGQARAKRTLATSVYTHFLLAAARRRAGKSAVGAPKAARQHVLLLGPSGSGKSLLVRTLAEYLGLPFVRADATRFTEAGYVGEDVSSLLFRLVRAAGKNREAAETGIVFLDEIDKIAGSGADLDVSRLGVQQALLSILDGGEHRVTARDQSELQVDTSFVLFVCAGAFPGIERILQRRVGRGDRLGFDGAQETTPPSLHDVNAEDLESFGFLPELIGRFGAITALDELKEPELVEILRNAEDSAMQRERDLFALHGIELRIAPDVYEGLARRALRNRTGARALDQALGRVFEPLRFDLPQLAERGVHTIRVADPERSGEPACEMEEAPAPIGEPAPFEELRTRIGSRKPARSGGDRPRGQGSADAAPPRRTTLGELEREFGVPALGGEELQLYRALRRHFVAAEYELVWLFTGLQRASCTLGQLLEALGTAESWESRCLLAEAQWARTRAEQDAARQRRKKHVPLRRVPTPRRRAELRSRWIAAKGVAHLRLTPLERTCLAALGDGELAVRELLLRVFVELGGRQEEFLRRAEAGLEHLLQQGVLCAFDGRQPESPDLDGRELLPLRGRVRWVPRLSAWSCPEELRHVVLYRAREPGSGAGQPQQSAG